MSKLKIVGAVFIVGFCILFATSPSGVTPPQTPEGSFMGLVPPWPVFNVAVKINSFFATSALVTTPPDVAALDLATAWFKSEVSYALAKNGIIDLVGSSKPGTMTCGEVAISLDLQEFVVCQYMEAGVQLNLMDRCDSSQTYSLTPVGDMFLEDKLQSFLLMINEVRFVLDLVSDLCLYLLVRDRFSDRSHSHCFSSLQYNTPHLIQTQTQTQIQETQQAWRGTSTKVIKSGKMSGFEATFGTDFWTYHTASPELGQQFDGAMKALAPGPTGAMLSDWKPPRDDILLCDIGGGLGHVLGHVLEHYPKMRGLVFDLPDTAKGANLYLKEKGLSDRAEAIGGDFFADLPAPFAECDVYHLRFIIHDWPDAENLSILKNIKESAERAPTKTEKSIIVMDHIIKTGASPAMEQAKSLMSLNMVSVNPYGARERTVEEHAKLFAAAGFSGANDVKQTPLRSILTLLEAEI